jgi:hypothetical protein
MKRVLIAPLFVLLSLVSVPIGASKATTTNALEAPFNSTVAAQHRRYRRYRRYRGPVRATSAPVGANARCQDGTYSFSQHRRGICSHHGGVAVWL